MNGLVYESLQNLLDFERVGKLPNHPTFSKESIYSSSNYEGGSWVENGGKWGFLPSQDMMRYGNT